MTIFFVSICICKRHDERVLFFKYYGEDEDEDEREDSDNHNDRSASRFSQQHRRRRSESPESSLKRIGKRDSSNEETSDNEDEQRTKQSSYSRRDSLVSKRSSRPKSIDSRGKSCCFSLIEILNCVNDNLRELSEP